MRINKNELGHMINQIDDDLLNEAAEEYNTQNFGAWKRVIPVAACIILLISGTAVSVLKNSITIETGHEGMREDTTGKSKETADSVISESGSGVLNYSIQAEEEKDREIDTLFDTITASLKEQGFPENAVITFMELKIIPESRTVSGGTIVLMEPENFSEITVNIDKNNIIIKSKSDKQDVTYSDVFHETAEESTTRAVDGVSFENQARWNDLIEVMNGISEMASSEYINIQLDYSYENVLDADADEYMLLQDGILSAIDGKSDKLLATPYTYLVTVELWSETDAMAENVLVLVE